MSRSDSDTGKSLPDASLHSAPEFIAPEPAERQQGPIWLVAIGCSLLAGVALLFTSPPVISSGDGRVKRPRRKPPAETVSAPAVLKEGDESHREPWWLLAFTSVVVIGIGLLLIFYAHLPPFLRY